jgi:hypothetical protein
MISYQTSSIRLDSLHADDERNNPRRPFSGRRKGALERRDSQGEFQKADNEPDRQEDPKREIASDDRSGRRSRDIEGDRGKH